MRVIDRFNGEYAFLSNFYWVDGITVEHLYQALKSTFLPEVEEILAAPTPGEAKRLGQKATLRSEWETSKESVMLDCLRLKFSNPEMRKRLLATGDAELIEGNHWHDTYWGRCTCSKHKGAGKNRLGQLLMQIREEYVKELTDESRKSRMGT
jgi:ribA/ribD-fused uncharacterized protein